MFAFCKVNLLLISKLLNMIIESVGRRVGGRCIGRSVGKWSVVGWSVVGGFNKTRIFRRIPNFTSQQIKK